MKAILQYCATDDGTYKNIGTLRLRKGKAYKIKALTEKDRLGNPEIIAHEISCAVTALALNTDFLDQTLWYFRVAFFDDLTMIKLGQQRYKVDYDGLININEIVYNKVKISFIVDYDQFSTYAVPVSLPVSEGGVVLEDDGVYIS